MEFAVAGIFGALENAVLPAIVSAFKAKLKKPLPCMKDVEELRRALLLIIAKIKDHDALYHGRIISHEQEESVNQLRRLAYEIEDCTEGFLRQVMSDDGLEKKDATAKFGEEIRRLLSSAKEWETRFNVPGGASSSSSSAGAPDSTAATPYPGLLVGMEEPLEELMKLVAEANVKSERKLKVISIVGFGGLGKTLLASQLFDRVKENCKFDLRVWIRADDKNADQLLQEIVQKVGNRNPNNVAVVPPAQNLDWFFRAASRILPTKSNNAVANRPEGNQLARKLQALLKNKRYLIVIIDMRTKDQWYGITGAFTWTSEIDSRIIVTTTKLPVARCCSYMAGRVYKMRTLTGDDPRTLFFHPDAPQLQGSSEIIFNKCGGLPLALISVSENCRGEMHQLEEKTEEAFAKICGPQDAGTSMNDGGLNTPSERMRRMLLSSYQDLPNSVVKVCLQYLCMFPPDEDGNIRKNSVMRRLLAERIAQTGYGNVQVRDFEIFIDHCVAQPTEVSNNGKTKRCKVPGIVLEYITRMAQSQGFVTVCDGNQTAQPRPDGARRLSFHPNSKIQWKLPEETEPKVRTLAVFGSKDEATTLSNKEAIAKCELLRVLDLQGCGGLDRSDFKNICCKLLLLKYLSLGASITEVPRSIRNLQVLETLDLRKTMIKFVPVEVIKLPHLKNLLGKFQLAEDGVFRKLDYVLGMQDKAVTKNLVEFLTSQSRLEMLSGFVTSHNPGFPQLLIHMSKLWKVKIWLGTTTNKKNMEYLSAGILKFLCLKEHDHHRALSIYIHDCPKEMSEDLFLNSLVHEQGQDQSLYSFKLYGTLNRFPDFLTRLESIKELCLSGTDLSADKMQDGLNRLKNSSLVYLKLVEKRLGTLKLPKEKFKLLVRICLVAEEITGEITISDEYQPRDAAQPSDAPLPSLVSLHVLCEDLDGLSGIDILSFPNLKEVGLHSRVKGKTKDDWETAARSHPKWPNLVLIDPPKPKGS